MKPGTMLVGAMTLFWVSDLALAGTYLREEQRISGVVGAPTQSVVVESWYQGDLVKKSIGGTDSTFIVDMKAQRVVVLQNTQRSYWTLPPEQYQQMTRMSLQAFGLGAHQQGKATNLFKLTGRTRKIGKWNAYEVALQMTAQNGKVTMWFSKDVGLEQGAFVQLMRASLANQTSDLEEFLKQLQKLEGYPVLSVAEFDLNGQRVVFTQQLKEVKSKNFAASSFAIPKGFVEVANPLQQAAVPTTPNRAGAQP